MTKRSGSVYVDIEDIRRLGPSAWLHQLDDSVTTLLPSRGSVRSPNGLVHAIIGDHTYCDIQWAAYSRKEQRTLRVMEWEPCDAAVTCLECVVET